MFTVSILSVDCMMLGSAQNSTGTVLITVDLNGHVEFEHNANLSLQPVGREFAETETCAADATASF
jgi:hypothetical protein